MDARKTVTFLKSPTGLVLFFLVALLFLVLLSGNVIGRQSAASGSSGKPPAATGQASNSSAGKGSDVPKALEVFDRNTTPLRISNPPPAKQLAAPLRVVAPRPVAAAAAGTPAPPPLPPKPQRKPEAIKIYATAERIRPGDPQPQSQEMGFQFASAQSSRPALRKFGQRYAPYGRLVKCELVNTLDSSKSETPIIGLVTEDVSWNHELIIPAGTEVHGTLATRKENRDRLASNDRWVIVLPASNDAPHGAEMVVAGRALDMSDVRGDAQSWGITDGSYGIQGYTIKTANAEEIKLFISTFLSASAQALQSRQSTLLGQQLEATPQNAALNGTSAVLNRYAENIAAEIREFGSYTRVPAGKQFYLYVEQTVDAADARVGDSTTKSRRDSTGDYYDPAEWRARAAYERLGVLREEPFSPAATRQFYRQPAPVPTTNPFVPSSSLPDQTISFLPYSPSTDYRQSPSPR